MSCIKSDIRLNAGVTVQQGERILIACYAAKLDFGDIYISENGAPTREKNWF